MNIPVLAGNPEGIHQLEEGKWENNTETDERICGVDWTYLAEDLEKWSAVVDTLKSSGCVNDGRVS
jgi:hypothetical protein